MTKTETVTVVDQAAYDEPIYESHQVCKVCNKDFGKGENATVEAINHSVETGHSYHSTSVKVDKTSRCNYTSGNKDNCCDTCLRRRKSNRLQMFVW